MNVSQCVTEIEGNPKRLIYMQEDNKLVRLINKGLILGKDPDVLASEISLDYASIASSSEIVSLIMTIKDAIKANSEAGLSKQDIMHAEKIVLNLLNKDPDLKTIEIISDVKVALAINGHGSELETIIKSIRAKHLVDFESLGIDPRFKPRRKDFYIVEEEKGVFTAVAPANSKPSGYVIGFSKNKVFFLGYKAGIIKQEHTRNYHRIRLIYGLAPGGKIIKKLTNKEIICKNVPLEEIPDSLADDIKAKFIGSSEGIYVGFELSGNSIRRSNEQAELAMIPMTEIMDDIQSRVAVVGSPGSAKTVVTNIMQRQIMQNEKYLQGGAVTIAKDVPNLTNVGHQFTSFGQFYPDWDEDNASQEFLDHVKLGRSDLHKKITISDDVLIPDLNELSKETIIALINNSPCSEQSKSALRRSVEETDDVVDVLKRARDGNLLGEEYLSSQDTALQRLMNSIIPANYDRINKIDIRKALEDNKYVAFFIKGLNGDTFATMIMWELYSLQKSKEIVNPIVQGRLVTIDEGQKFVRYPAFKDIYQRMVLDGRNFGICMITIFQNEKEAEKSMSYPDFVVYRTYLENGKRIMSVRDMTVLIPTIAPEAT